MSVPHLLGISGSIRRDSTNTAILQTMAGALSGKATMTLFPLYDIPLYNSDLEGEHLPTSVHALKAAITAADGLVICSPEYNHGTSGVLKNALDWASRPAFNSPLKNKPALIMSSSPGALGGARAHAQLRETLASANSRVIARPQVTIAGIFQKVAGGRLTDEAALKFCLDAVDDLLFEIGLLTQRAA